MKSTEAGQVRQVPALAVNYEGEMSGPRPVELPRHSIAGVLPRIDRLGNRTAEFIFSANAVLFDISGIASSQ